MRKQQNKVEKVLGIQYRTLWDTGHDTWEPIESYPGGEKARALIKFKSRNESRYKGVCDEKKQHETRRRHRKEPTFEVPLSISGTMMSFVGTQEEKAAVTKRKTSQRKRPERTERNRLGQWK